MVLRLSLATVFFAISSGTALWSQTTITSNPPIITNSTDGFSNLGSLEIASGGRYFCPKCGVYHSRSVSPAGGVTQSTFPSQVAQVQYVNGGLRTGGQMSSRGTSNVLDMLNRQRRNRGLGTLGYDAQLQAVASRRAARMASTGTKGHPSGSFAPGRYEGVGWSSSYSPAAVSACFTSDPRMRFAGAAMATGSDGVYFCVVYR